MLFIFSIQLAEQTFDVFEVRNRSDGAMTNILVLLTPPRVTFSQTNTATANYFIFSIQLAGQTFDDIEVRNKSDGGACQIFWYC